MHYDWHAFWQGAKQASNISDAKILSDLKSDLKLYILGSYNCDVSEHHIKSTIKGISQGFISC